MNRMGDSVLGHMQVASEKLLGAFQSDRQPHHYPCTSMSEPDRRNSCWAPVSFQAAVLEMADHRDTGDGGFLWDHFGVSLGACIQPSSPDSAAAARAVTSRMA